MITTKPTTQQEFVQETVEQETATKGILWKQLLSLATIIGWIAYYNYQPKLLEVVPGHFLRCFLIKQP